MNFELMFIGYVIFFFLCFSFEYFWLLDHLQCVSVNWGGSTEDDQVI